MKYGNFRTKNNTHIYEERAILRKWIEKKFIYLKLYKYNYFI